MSKGHAALSMCARHGLMVMEDVCIRKEWTNIEYIIALSESDMDNLSVCNLVHRIYHTDKGGKITLAVSYRDHRAYFTVEDDSEGIEPSMTEKIFDEFVSRTGKSMDQKRGIPVP